MKKFILALYMAACFSLFAERIPVENISALNGWHFNGKGTTADNKMLKISPTAEDAKTVKGLLGIYKGFTYKQFAGKKVQLSAEMKYENVSPFGKQYCGTKFMTVAAGRYYGTRDQIGTGDWRKVFLTFPMPANGSFTLFLGMQGARGTVYFRNIEIHEAETFISLTKAANMGFADDNEKDGKGGWSDQGFENDGSKFDFKKGVYANVPFQVIDPAKNNGKSILSFGSQNFPKGILKAELDGRKASANYLYLLHTTCWAANKGNAGIITLHGEKGSQKIEVKFGKDAADQWNPTAKQNAIVADSWNNGAGTTNGVYVSNFPIDQKIGKIRAITLSKGNTECCWIVIGITLSSQKYPLPVKKNYVVTESDRFRPVAECSSRVKPGSALDFSCLNTGKIERLIINKEGRLAKESCPDKPFRIFAVQDGMQLSDHYAAQDDHKRKLTIEASWKTKQDVKDHIEELVRHGCNMLRIHKFDFVVVKNGTVTFDKKSMDFFDYGIFLCKQNGIYIQIDTMADTGFTGLSPWSRQGAAVNAKYRMLFDEKMREEYRIGMKAFLNHVNPYTKTALKDDPVLGYINYNNEQEFAFIKSPYGPEGLAEWRKFIGDPNAKMFTAKEWRSKTEKGKKINEFITMKWRFLLDWYRNLFRNEIGCKAVAGFLEMTGSMHYNVLRNDLDGVMMHGYHGHTSEECTAQSQGSDIASGMKQARTLMDSRIAGRPFMVNEYASVYWGRYRHEEPYAVGAYAAFQGFDMLVRHGFVIHQKKAVRLFPWIMGPDPITRASLRATALMYARGDVQEAKRGIRLVFSEKGINDNKIWMEALNGSQSRLALIAKFGLEQSDPAKHIKKPADLYNDLRLPLKGGSVIVENAQGHVGFATSIEKIGISDNASMLDFIKLMKMKGVIAKNNRSDGANIFESSTGELYANLPEMYMTVNTPRFQGLCGRQGAKASLKNLNFELIRTPAALSAASLDPKKNLEKTDRLLIIFSTNALSNKMRFDDESMRKVRYYGESPVMIETGRFKIVIPTSKAYTVYPLRNDGSRCMPLPAVFKDGKQIIDIDTLKLPGGPSIYYELVRK